MNTYTVTSTNGKKEKLNCIIQVSIHVLSKSMSKLHYRKTDMEIDVRKEQGYYFSLEIDLLVNLNATSHLCQYQKSQKIQVLILS
jgi:hypothetical protein